MKLKKYLAALSLGVLFATSAAAQVTFFPPVTAFEDDDIDFWIDENSSGVLDVGDRLVAPFEMTRTFGLFGGGPADFGTSELTGVADITVTSATFNAAANTWTYTFGPSGGAGFLGGLDAGAMAALWLDPTPDLQITPPNCISLLNCVALASDGALWAVVGFNGDFNEGWVATTEPGVTNNPLTLIGTPGTTKVGTVNFWLNVLVNNTGETFAPQPCLAAGCPPGGDNAVQVIGSGDLLGGQGLTNGAFARSDFDFQVATVAVPEPSVLALVGLALLGLGATRRRKTH